MVTPRENDSMLFLKAELLKATRSPQTIKRCCAVFNCTSWSSVARDRDKRGGFRGEDSGAQPDPARRGSIEDAAEGRVAQHMFLLVTWPWHLLQDAQLCVGQTIVSWESLVAGVPSCSIWSGRAQGELPAPVLQQPEHQSRQQIAPARMITWSEPTSAGPSSLKFGSAAGSWALLTHMHTYQYMHTHIHACSVLFLLPALKQAVGCLWSFVSFCPWICTQLCVHHAILAT